MIGPIHSVQINSIFPGSLIFNVVPLSLESSIVSITLRFTSLSDSPFDNLFTLTLLVPANNVNMALTNSTCANFLPGQTLGPMDHGMNVPLEGSMSCSCSSPIELLLHRLGLQDRASCPQILGFV